MDRNEIIKKAKDFCDTHHIDNYPVNIVSLCASHGITVFEEYLPPNVSGFIVVQKENFAKYGTNRVIVVNFADSANRRRFTIAHELAHYLLHSKDDQVFAHRDAGQNGGIENEANIFASNILMPEELVKKALSQIDDIARIAPPSLKANYISLNFAVSIPAAKVRLSQLGIH